MGYVGQSWDYAVKYLVTPSVQRESTTEISADWQWSAMINDQKEATAVEKWLSQVLYQS